MSDAQSEPTTVLQNRGERINLVTSADEVQILMAVQQAITSRLDLDVVLQMIADEARRLTSAQMSAVCLLKESRLMVEVGSGDVLGSLLGSPVPLQASAEGWALETSQSFLVDGTETIERRRSFLETKSGAKTVVIVPLVSGSCALGLIVVANREAGTLDENDRSLLMMLAPGATIALENARLYEQAQQAAVLEERQRLARELHDSVSQTLFSASLIADVLPRLYEKDPQEGLHRLEELRLLTRGALAEMRSLLMELRPGTLEEANFSDLVQQLGDAMTARSRVPVRFAQQGECALPREVKLALYRILQEAFNHISRHANAAEVNVRLVCKQACVILKIEENGPGFPRSPGPASPAGLSVIEERARSIGASIHVTNWQGEGTNISICWPVPGAASEVKE